MHGLINKAIEALVKETYGPATWQAVADHAGLGFAEFEAMLSYDPAITTRTMAALGAVLKRPVDGVMEDLGTFLVTSPSIPAIRRLLRFGGVSYEEFLHSLEELPDRVRLAVDDLVLPPLVLLEEGEGCFRLLCHPGLEGYGHLMMGVLRAMADDYGALAMLDHQGSGPEGDIIAITLVEDAFSEGKAFELGMRSA